MELQSRVVGHFEGERNFHIFYQLLAACADSQLGELTKRKLDKKLSFMHMCESTIFFF